MSHVPFERRFRLLKMHRRFTPMQFRNVRSSPWTVCFGGDTRLGHRSSFIGASVACVKQPDPFFLIANGIFRKKNSIRFSGSRLTTTRPFHGQKDCKVRLNRSVTAQAVRFLADREAVASPLKLDFAVFLIV